jgi:putative transposase
VVRPQHPQEVGERLLAKRDGGARIASCSSPPSKVVTVAATETALGKLLGADLSKLDLVGLIIDGVHFGEHCCVVALGIGIDGTHLLALVDDSPRTPS